MEVSVQNIIDFFDPDKIQCRICKKWFSQKLGPGNPVFFMYSHRSSSGEVTHTCHDCLVMTVIGNADELINVIDPNMKRCWKCQEWYNVNDKFLNFFGLCEICFSKAQQEMRDTDADLGRRS